MSERLVLSPAVTRALSLLSRSLLASARTWTLYPPEHPVVCAAMARFQQAITAAVEADAAFGISVTPTTLLIRGTPAGDDPVIVQAASFLHARGILEIGFDGVVPPDAIGRLLTFLGQIAAGSLDISGSLTDAWRTRGHPAIHLQAVDYAKVLENRDEKAAAKRDDLWRSIAAALTSGRRTLDEREQRRLLEMAGDPGELAALAETLIAEKCTPDGAPLVSTQATIVLGAFRHLATLAAVIAPDRAQAILKNLATALLELDPHVSVQVLATEREQQGAGDGAGRGDVPTLASVFDEETIARLLATVIALEGQASPRLANVFDLLVPDAMDRRRVLDRARAHMEAKQTATTGSLDVLWGSIEQLLLGYDDRAYVSDDYRAVLDGSRAAASGRPGTLALEIDDWLATVADASIRDLSIVLLADLLALEGDSERAVPILNHLADLVDDLLVAGAYADAGRVLDAIAGASTRPGLAGKALQTRERIGAGAGMHEAAVTIGEIGEPEWKDLLRCSAAIGSSCLPAFDAALTDPADTASSARAVEAAVAIGSNAIPHLSALLTAAGGAGSASKTAGPVRAVRVRLASAFGQIASASAVPALQGLLRDRDPHVVRASVRALAVIEDDAAARAIHVALRATDGERRQMVVDALVDARDRRVVPMLVRVLESCRPLKQDYQVTLHALDACARVKDTRAVPAVTTVMFVSAWFSRRRLRALRQAAVRTLVEIGGPSAVQALDRGSRNGDRMLRGIIRAERGQAES